VTEDIHTHGQTVPGRVADPAAEARLREVCDTFCPKPDLGAAAAALLAALAEWTGAVRGSILVLNPASGRLAIAAGMGLREDLLGQELTPRPRSISEWVLRNRRGLILNGEVRDQRFAGTATADGIESALSLPLIGPDGPVGVLNLARLSPSPVFGEAEMAALEPRLAPVAEALARVQFVHLALRGRAHFVAAATGSGSALLPPGLTELRHHELALAHRAAWSPGCDRCERAPHPNGDQSLLVIDPMGRGVLAGATAAFVHGLFVTLATPERSAAGIAARLSAEVHVRLGPRHTSAAWIAQLSARGELSYCNAGHTWPLWVPADGGKVARLDRGGPLLGALPAARYEEEHLRLLPGDLLLVASDGVLDARGPADQPFGFDRLAELASSSRRLPLERLAEGVIETVIEFSSRTVPTDDLTVLALRYHPAD
jgi:sigma-B regulation protein RsbU (phosphoserine phosphatase)